MSQITDMLENISGSDNYYENGRILMFLGNILKSNKASRQEKAYISRFAVKEMNRLSTVIPAENSYKKKDEMFFYEDKLLMIYTLSTEKPDSTSDEDIDTIRRLVTLVDGECSVEKAVDKLFELEKADKPDVDKVIETVKSIDDEYRRGKFYQGVNEYKDRIAKFTPDAKAALADYTADEIERFSAKAPFGEDESNVLELIADVCKYFITDKLLGLLEKLLSVGTNNIRYYALETLFDNGRFGYGDAVEELAEDLVYADLTYSLLSKYNKTELFPAELRDPEYLAESDMVRWLVYPTELGKKPDEIKLLGSATVKKEKYYIFKYKSDSDNLSDDLKNVWLVGWSNADGGTFSEFEPLSAYEKKTDEKTLKYIVKKAIK